jgi:YHS domain-containing protein
MKDPICGMNVNDSSKFRSSYNGREYFFCSIACKQSFDKNPGAYAKGK